MIQNYAIIDYGQTLWYNSITNCSLSIFFLQYEMMKLEICYVSLFNTINAHIYRCLYNFSIL